MIFLISLLLTIVFNFPFTFDWFNSDETSSYNSDKAWWYGTKIPKMLKEKKWSSSKEKLYSTLKFNKKVRKFEKDYDLKEWYFK